MISYEEALKRVLAIAAPLGAETIRIEKAAGRVLAADIIARSASPAQDVSAMDGYGVHEADLEQLPARLPVSMESFAGSAPLPALQPGGCVRIFTGAPVPPGVGRIIIQENVRRDGEIAIFEGAPGAGRNIRRAGGDFEAGDTLLKAGTRLNWRRMATAAAADRDSLSVWRRPEAIILATGDELASPGSAHKSPGCIPESVSFAIRAFLTDLGAQVIGSVRLADNMDRLEAAASDALEKADLIVVTGGASVGEKDYARAMFAGHALEEVFTKVAIKPGKPVWMARAGKTMIVGLPGNPTSALVTARLFLKPLIYAMTGRAAESANQIGTMICHDALGETKGREVFLRAYLSGGEAHLFSNQDSSAQSILSRADILIWRRANAPALPAGSAVNVLDFN